MIIVALLALRIGIVHRDETMWGAATDGDVDTMRSMMRWGASPDVTFVSGETALQVAVHNNQLEGAKFLMEHGGDMQRRTPDGQSLMDLAGTPEMRELIRSHSK